MSDQTAPTDENANLGKLIQEAGAMRTGGRHRTGMRLALEARRLAESEHLLAEYLDASFQIMNLSQHLIEPGVGRDAAVRCIALLESEERARHFQSNYSENEYRNRVYWLTACSYDNLATATGNLNGYNSPGMQACIADGIRVCRRTGKTKCITCFQEYATEVFRAADDLPMALHHARANVARPPTPQFDRRWGASLDETELLILAGSLTAALDAGRRTATLIPSYFSPIHATRKTRPLLKTLHLLAGIEDKTDQILPASVVTAEGEDPENEWREAMYAAAAESVAKNHDAALSTLTRWDQLLSTAKCLHLWFETRLRVIAAYLLAGQGDRALRLAAPLRDKAREASDFLTLRRLDGLLDKSRPVSPIPTLRGFDVGPFAAAMPAPVIAENLPPAAQSQHSPAQPQQTPLQETIESIERLASAKPTPPASAILRPLLSIVPAAVTDRKDASQLLFLASQFTAAAEADQRLWTWAKAISAMHPRDGGVISLLAEFGRRLVQREKDPVSKPGKDEVASLFRESLSLSADDFAVFGRAGLYYLSLGNESEAERCLARSFRLNRGIELTAHELATLYARSDRRSDALAVRDMAIRENARSPRLFWSAAIDAIQLGRDRSALTYLDRYESLYPNQPWVNYYRACAFLKLGEPENARTAIELEAPRIKGIFQIHCVRAAAAAAMKDIPAAQAAIEATLGVPLFEITDMNAGGLTANLERLVTAANAIEQPVLLEAVHARLYHSGLYPAGYFDRRRQSAPKVTGLSHFECTLRQDLDGNWATSAGCLSDQTKWTRYQVVIGVLATDSETARDIALGWQSQAYSIPPTFVSAKQTGSGYHDHPGITWYGRREGESPPPTT